MKLFAGNMPRWIILLIDLLICLVSLVLAYELRFNFSIPPKYFFTLGYVIRFMLGIRLISFLISKTYVGIIRYTGSKDVQRIFIAISAGTAFFAAYNVLQYAFGYKYLIPFSILIIDYMASIFIMTSTRVMVKLLYAEIAGSSKERANVIIFGAGEAGIITKQTLDRDAGTKYKVLAYIDEDPKKSGKRLEDTMIYSMDELESLLRDNQVAHLIISAQRIPSSKKEKLTDLCFKYNTKVLSVPRVNSWINGQLSFKQIKKINIEELLERDPILLDKEKIKQQLSGKVVLVTGGAGSIGSEIARQVIQFSPKKLILLDQAESPLYEIELEMQQLGSNATIEIVVGDIRNIERMENVFSTFRPEVVFHAAAYKHVPMMENNPSEAILTNILGTKNMADLAVKYTISEFVMVSTDKAVNPTSVMGASKRIAEIYTQALGSKGSTKFITTRFGNVLGSNGSVIPLFKKQIERGGPITITHPDITRFFMTIPEACQLVLEAGAMGKGGEIFIFDMGESIKVLDLAKKIISLSGLTLDKDIQIVYTGLRPGEKLYEELLTNKENSVPTYHKQIMIAKVEKYDFEKVKSSIDTLIGLFTTQNNIEIVKQMKVLVPEYKSNNSVFEKLDA